MKEEVIQYPALDKIDADENVRKVFSEDSIRGMMLSMLEVGQLQPVRLRKKTGDRFALVDGERRVRAARLARWLKIAAIIEGKDLSSGEIRQRQLISNCQRESLSALERAQGIEDLIQETKWTAAEAAAKLGFSVATVSKLRGLLLLPDAIREQVASGTIPASAAYELTRVDDPAKQTELASQIVQGRLSRDGVSGAVKRRNKSGETVTAPVGRATAALGGGRSVTLSGSGLSMDTLISWLEELLGKARKIRTQGLELATFLKMLKDQAHAS